MLGKVAWELELEGFVGEITWRCRSFGGSNLETNAKYWPVILPEFKLRSGALKWSLNLKGLAFLHDQENLQNQAYTWAYSFKGSKSMMTQQRHWHRNS